MNIFTDGGCVGNGRKHARAAYAVYNGTYIIRGHVMPNVYKYVGDKLVTTDEYIQPSNNRGEILAIIMCFIDLLENIGNERNVSIYSDSYITIKTITSWYENRVKKNTLHELKNLDLLNILMYLYSNVTKVYSVRLVHVRGHQKITNNSSKKEIEIINGNNLADSHCTEMLKRKDFTSKEIINF
jgi:ribonuclease HI